MTTFHTVKKAAEIAGKSPSSIRRIIHPIIHEDEHPDRDQIRPTVEDARELRMKGLNFAWQISDELLRREIPIQQEAEKGSDRSQGQPHPKGSTDLIAMLQGELAIKNQQIDQQSRMLSQQMELISSLSERIREGNVLMGSLQQQLALPESTRANPAFVDVQAAKPQAATQTPKTTPKSANKSAKPKRGFLLRLFR